MKALIKTTANNWGSAHEKNGKLIHEYLVANRGKWVDIDTSHLFNNQYNTLDGFRIFDKDIKEIKEDARLNKGQCNYCGTITDFNLPCLKHAECVNYGSKDFNKCFFIKNPKGSDPIIETNISNDLANNKKFWSFYSVNSHYYRISRRRNIEFVLVSGVPYIVGLGYTHYLNARLSDNEIKILLHCVKLLKNRKEIVF